MGELIEPRVLKGFRDFLPARPSGTRLACELAGHPGAARLFPGRLSLFSTAFAPLGLLDRLEAAGLSPLRVPGLGSVGVAAAWTALRLSGSGVYLAGLDFSYPRGCTHARGTPAHLGALAAASRFAPPGHAAAAALAGRAMSWHASAGPGRVRSDAVLLSYRDLLETVVRDDGTGADDAAAPDTHAVDHGDTGPEPAVVLDHYAQSSPGLGRHGDVGASAHHVATAADVAVGGQHHVRADLDPGERIHDAARTDVGARADGQRPVLAGEDAAAADQHAVTDSELAWCTAARIELAALVDRDPPADPHLAGVPEADVALPERAPAKAPEQAAPPGQLPEREPYGPGQHGTPRNHEFVVHEP